MLKIGNLIAAGLIVALAAPAAAQDNQTAPSPESDWGTDQGSTQLQNPSLQQEQATMNPEPTRPPNSPHEDPTKGYWFLGAFYRHTWTPAFILKLFLDDITSANNPGTGLELTYRKDNLDITTNVYWQSYHDYGPFRTSGDPLGNTEIINSHLSVIGIGANFLWSTSFNDVFALEYGIDVGVGVVMGDMIRDEAYPEPDKSVAGQKAGWAPCMGPNNPTTNSLGQAVGNGSTYCDSPSVPAGQKGEQYHVKALRWTQGGSVPNVWFRLALPHLALRIKPMKQMVMRVDFGFDLFSGFFVGGGLAFGL